MATRAGPRPRLERDRPRLLPRGDVDVRLVDRVDLGFGDGPGVEVGQRLADGLAPQGGRRRPSGPRGPFGAPSRAGTRDPDLAGQTLMHVVEGFVHLRFVDLDGETDLVALFGRGCGSHTNRGVYRPPGPRLSGPDRAVGDSDGTPGRRPTRGRSAGRSDHEGHRLEHPVAECHVALDAHLTGARTRAGSTRPNPSRQNVSWSMVRLTVGRAGSGVRHRRGPAAATATVSCRPRTPVTAKQHRGAVGWGHPLPHHVRHGRSQRSSDRRLARAVAAARAPRPGECPARGPTCRGPGSPGTRDRGPRPPGSSRPRRTVRPGRSRSSSMRRPVTAMNSASTSCRDRPAGLHPGLVHLAEGSARARADVERRRAACRPRSMRSTPMRWESWSLPSTRGVRGQVPLGGRSSQAEANDAHTSTRWSTTGSWWPASCPERLPSGGGPGGSDARSAGEVRLDGVDDLRRLGVHHRRNR